MAKTKQAPLVVLTGSVSYFPTDSKGKPDRSNGVQYLRVGDEVKGKLSKTEIDELQASGVVGPATGPVYHGEGVPQADFNAMEARAVRLEATLAKVKEIAPDAVKKAEADIKAEEDAAKTKS